MESKIWNNEFSLKEKTKRPDSAVFSVRIMKAALPMIHPWEYNRGHKSTESIVSYFPVA